MILGGVQLQLPPLEARVVAVPMWSTEGNWKVFEIKIDD